MNYEVVEMKAKVFAGVSEVTNNSAPDMTTKIGGLWQKFYSGLVQKMENRTNNKCVGLYCDYKQNGDYSVLIGCEIDSNKKEESEKLGLVLKTVPAGKYAKFEFYGDVQKAVAESWNEIWKLPLERTFTGDYEEYQEDCDGKTGTIHIYIAIK